MALGTLALGASVAPSPAQAQTNTPALRGAVGDSYRSPSLATPATPASNRISAQPPADDALASPDLRPAIPEDDPTSDPLDPLLDDTPRPAAGERAPVVDGDMTLPEERTAIARDGIVEVGEPLAPQDGADPTVIDSRPQEEADLFRSRILIPSAPTAARPASSTRNPMIPSASASEVSSISPK
jgi:hypothetical protein